MLVVPKIWDEQSEKENVTLKSREHMIINKIFVEKRWKHFLIKNRSLSYVSWSSWQERLRWTRCVRTVIIWLVPRAGKMNQIARCDWLPERARWSHLARSGLPAVSRKKNFTKSQIIKPLLTKFVRSRWLDIGLVLFMRVYGPRLRLGP